jgi:hypothetical protein
MTFSSLTVCADRISAPTLSLSPDREGGLASYPSFRSDHKNAASSEAARSEHTDPTYAIWLPGMKIQWPDCNRAADQLDELAPLHSIALVESGASRTSVSYTLR